MLDFSSGTAARHSPQSSCRPSKSSPTHPSMPQNHPAQHLKLQTRSSQISSLAISQQVSHHSKVPTRQLNLVPHPFFLSPPGIAPARINPPQQQLSPVAMAQTAHPHLSQALFPFLRAQHRCHRLPKPVRSSRVSNHRRPLCHHKCHIPSLAQTSRPTI